jgi:hypothetical protein
MYVPPDSFLSNDIPRNNLIEFRSWFEKWLLIDLKWLLIYFWNYIWLLIDFWELICKNKINM